jgi:hypothetical protein
MGTPNGATPTPRWQDLVGARQDAAHAANCARRDTMHAAGMCPMASDAGQTTKKFVSVDRPPDTQSY